MDERSALIAMSGGVDSAVAACLTAREGFRCVGASMRLWRGGEDPAPAAARAAVQLGIPFRALDLTEEFERGVIQKFIRVYEAGGTPNPCVDCNRCMKFGRLMEAADSLGCHFLVTGHYARVSRGEDGRFLLRKALDPAKDQSYVLYSLTQQQLARVRFPLGELTKEQVRKIAEGLGLESAHRRESQDICFVPDGDYAAFMERYTGKTYPAGDFLDTGGAVLGRHRGAVRYTLGQRRGLALPMGERVYVCGKDMARNTVTVGPESALSSSALVAGEMNWISAAALAAPMRVRAKTRYRQREQDALVSPLPDGRVRVDFDTPQRAITPGQALVLYDGDLVVGGGTILRTL